MKQPHKKQGGGWQRRMRQKAAENPLLLKPKGFARPPLVKGGIQFHSFREALGESRILVWLPQVRAEPLVAVFRLRGRCIGRRFWCLVGAV
ncbi:MAG: hypothetical protein WCK77_17460 [Verrucomicrobiota bacterium]